jgi:hypothetical protein
LFNFIKEIVFVATKAKANAFPRGKAINILLIAPEHSGPKLYKKRFTCWQTLLDNLYIFI